MVPDSRRTHDPASLTVVTTTAAGTVTEAISFFTVTVSGNSTAHDLYEFERAIRVWRRLSDTWSALVIAVIKRMTRQRPHNVTPDPPWPRARDPPCAKPPTGGFFVFCARSL